MQVEIWSDVICPWCYIGKRRFEQALAGFAHKDSVQVIWRSFELDPNAPPQRAGTLQELLANKYRVSLQEAAGMNARVTSLAKEAGLEYHLDQARPGNTLGAHRLLHFASSRQLGDRASERLMRAYFSEALPVGEHAALAKLAPDFDITESEALAILDSDAYLQEVRADEARAADFGITAVPCFVIDENSSISGAQSVKTFADALQQAWSKSQLNVEG